MSHLPERNKDALNIIEGACNPVAVVNVIAKHSSEMLHAGEGMSAIEEDPALRLMVYQLAHLYGVLGDFEDFSKCMEAIEK